MKIINAIIYLNFMWKSFTSELMKFFLRLNGAKIGKNTYISLSSRIVCSKSLTIGNDCIIKSNVKIKAKNIFIGHGCIISENSYITGDDDFNLGNKSFIGKKVRINVSRKVEIGEDVGIGENSVIWTHGYFPPADEGYPITYAPVQIGDGAWVSTNIIILPGVAIGKGVIIGAGSVVTKNVEDDSLIAGNPAKFIKNTSEFRSSKGFIDIISSILSKYDLFVLIEKNENYLKYNFKSLLLYVLYGSDDKIYSLDIPIGSYIVFKSVNQPEIFRNNNFKWFDLSSREMTAKKSGNIDLIIDVFRSHGIRLIKNYSN